MGKLTRRTALLGLGGAAGWFAARHIAAAPDPLAGVPRLRQPEGNFILNDASGLSATPVARHSVVRSSGEALALEIKAEMIAAKAEGRRFNVGAARHSMGGQAIPRDGYAMTLDNGALELDSATGIYRVSAGARWSQVIAALDPLGFSPKVMQSNHDFGVAATFSVNAHGWPVPFGPMGHTVRAIRMVMPSGEMVRCSPTENADLFGHAMGGYGLIGAIYEMEVEAVANTRLVPSFEEMPATGFAPAFQQAIDDPSVTMAYGRLNVSRESFFTDALLITYREAPDQSDLPPAPGSGWMSHVASRLYRAQVGSEVMKRFRWWNETTVGPLLGGGQTTRNALINEPVATLDDRDPDRTDILHEYFVGFDRFGDFLTACREVIPASYQEFLNVTLRYVAPDDVSTLSYAPVPRIAAVMSFSQEMTQRAEVDMAAMTQALIHRILEIGGTYYLPYRPHATEEQFRRAYPRAEEFAAAKRAIDPDLVLRNGLWDRYMERL